MSKKEEMFSLVEQWRGSGLTRRKFANRQGQAAAKVEVKVENKVEDKAKAEAKIKDKAEIYEFRIYSFTNFLVIRQTTNNTKNQLSTELLFRYLLFDLHYSIANYL